MVVSILPHADFGRIGYLEDAHHFRKESSDDSYYNMYS